MAKKDQLQVEYQPETIIK
jgi:hypothetical protein